MGLCGRLSDGRRRLRVDSGGEVGEGGMGVAKGEKDM
jgi:hypothetical protein